MDSMCRKNTEEEKENEGEAKNPIQVLDLAVTTGGNHSWSYDHKIWALYNVKLQVPKTIYDLIRFL